MIQPMWSVIGLTRFGQVRRKPWQTGHAKVQWGGICHPKNLFLSIPMLKKSALRRLIGVLAMLLLPHAFADDMPVKIVKIGHAAPLTGRLASLGKDNENGARLAVEELNTQNIVIGGARIQFQLVGKDDAANPTVGVRVANELVAEGVAGVVGHMNSSTTIPASAVYFAAGIPQISPSATNADYTRHGYTTAFSLTANNAALPQVVAHYAIDTFKPARVVIVTDGTPYGNAATLSFEDTAARAQEQMLERVVIGPNQTNFTNEAERIRELAPDLVYFGGMDKTAAPLLNAIHAAGADPYFVGDDGICTESMARLADNADKAICGISEGKLFSNSAAIDDFKARYKSRFGYEPIAFSPYAYDGVKLLVQAMRKADSTDPKRYLGALKAIDYAGVMNDYQFGPEGDNLYRTVNIYGFKNRRKAVLATLEAR